jgi:hypothetical protein
LGAPPGAAPALSYVSHSRDGMSTRSEVARRLDYAAGLRRSCRTITASEVIILAAKDDVNIVAFRADCRLRVDSKTAGIAANAGMPAPT